MFMTLGLIKQYFEVYFNTSHTNSLSFPSHFPCLASSNYFSVICFKTQIHKLHCSVICNKENSWVTITRLRIFKLPALQKSSVPPSITVPSSSSKCCSPDLCGNTFLAIPMVLLFKYLSLNTTVQFLDFEYMCSVCIFQYGTAFVERFVCTINLFSLIDNIGFHCTTIYFLNYC